MKSRQSVLVILMMFTVCGLTLGQDIVISSPEITHWGEWGELELCPTGTFVYGFRLKVESDQGFFGDDSALNAVQLLCLSATVRRNSSEFQKADPLTRAFATVMSSEGFEGSWGPIVECPDPDFATGFELRSESDKGWTTDDSAANNFRLACSSGAVLEGNGHSWGDWTGQQNCPRGLRVCGIQTQVEGRNDEDDTTLNNVNLACCQ